MKEVVFGQEGLDYVVGRLRLGKRLAAALLRELALPRGRVTASLPDWVPDAEARQFEAGGKMRAWTESVFENVPGQTRHDQPDGLSLLTAEVLAFLRESPQRICVFEDALAKPRDPVIQADTNAWSYHDEVYRILTREADANAIRDSIVFSHAWLFIGVFSIAPRPFGGSIPRLRVLTDTDLVLIARAATKIVVGAYDGEGYLRWEGAGPTTQEGDRE